MEKIKRFYNQNRKNIFKWGAIIIVGYLMLRALNFYYEQKGKDVQENIQNSEINVVNNTITNNTVTNNNSEGTIKSTIDKFLEYCKTKEYSSAYEMLSEDTKEKNEYNTEEKFVDTFINNFYSSEDCVITKIGLIRDVYKIEKYKGNILSTGNAEVIKTMIIEIENNKINIEEETEHTNSN